MSALSDGSRRSSGHNGWHFVIVHLMHTWCIQLWAGPCCRYCVGGAVCIECWRVCVCVTAVTSGSSSLGTLCDTPLQAQSSSDATTTPIDSPTDSTTASSAAVGSHRLPSRLVSLSLYRISSHHHKLHTDRRLSLNLILKIPRSWKSWEKALDLGKTWKITGKWYVVVWSSTVQSVWSEAASKSIFPESMSCLVHQS